MLIKMLLEVREIVMCTEKDCTVHCVIVFLELCFGNSQELTVGYLTVVIAQAEIDIYYKGNYDLLGHLAM